jgi:hypothetical protein
MPDTVKTKKTAMNPRTKKETILSVTVKRARKNGRCENRPGKSRC